jgi:hypothetical protein
VLEEADGHIYRFEDALTEPNGSADAPVAFCPTSMVLLSLVLLKSKVNGFEKSGCPGVLATKEPMVE